jgi:hypothetical protein
MEERIIPVLRGDIPKQFPVVLDHEREGGAKERKEHLPETFREPYRLSPEEV